MLDVLLANVSNISFDTKKVHWSVNWHAGGGMNLSKKWLMILGFSPFIVNPIDMTLTSFWKNSRDLASLTAPHSSAKLRHSVSVHTPSMKIIMKRPGNS